MILLGTSGFSYPDWRGTFYPESLASRDYLSFYAEHFPALELNSSYYAIPAAALVGSLAERTPEDFRVVVKVFRGVTHERGAETLSVLDKFLQALEPLRLSGKLAALLLQFPYSFHFSESGMEFLGRLTAHLAGYPTVVEFRNVEWRKRRVWECLRESQAALCCVDEPRLPGLLPPEVAHTSDSLGYVRFHGRNAGKWWEHEAAWERYEYLYSEEELKEWARNIRWLESKTGVTYIFFNNHPYGYAVKNAKQMARVLWLSDRDMPGGPGPLHSGL